jgi:zinc transporter ZupT
LGAPLLAQASEPSAGAKVKRPRTSEEHRHYAFLGGGALLLGGVAFGFVAHGQAERARTLDQARESSKALDDARRSAATANMLYAAAGAVMIYAVLLELLPPSTAEKASLTFRF